MTIVAGLVAGILGITDWLGFVVYLVSQALVSARPGGRRAAPARPECDGAGRRARQRVRGNPPFGPSMCLPLLPRCHLTPARLGVIGARGRRNAQAAWEAGGRTRLAGAPRLLKIRNPPSPLPPGARPAQCVPLILVKCGGNVKKYFPSWWVPRTRSGRLQQRLGAARPHAGVFSKLQLPRSLPVPALPPGLTRACAAGATRLLTLTTRRCTNAPSLPNRCPLNATPRQGQSGPGARVLIDGHLVVCAVLDDRVQPRIRLLACSVHSRTHL
jgi:hypothetical protein